MLNPLIKNCRTGFHEDLLNRNAHYNKLTQIKTNIDNKNNYRYASHSNKKIQMIQQLKVKLNNQNIVKKLIGISQSQKRYLTEFKQEDSFKKSMRNSYKEKEKKMIISEENVRLLKKLQKVQSNLIFFKPSTSENKCPHARKQQTKFASSIKKIGQIDDLYYNTFKLQMINKLKPQLKLTSINEKRNKKKNKIKIKKQKNRQDNYVSLYDQSNKSLNLIQNDQINTNITQIQ